MKWKNKGKEINLYTDQFMEKWGKNVKIYLFGAGQIGEEISRTIGRFGLIKGFIDNDQRKHNTSLNSYCVISLDDYNNKRDGCIVVCTGKKNKDAIVKQLTENGFIEKRDFYEYDFFETRILPDLLFRSQDIVYVRLAQISLTERCTLKCIKCAHGCYATSHDSQDLSIELVYESVDTFFSIVDYIDEFVLIGGEPFLYRNIDKALIYISEKYRNKIGMFTITTNGTIMPAEKILELCNQFDITLRISNYQVAIPRLKEQYERLKRRLDEYEVQYIIGAGDHNWFDYGFDYLNHDGNESVLVDTFDKCATPCREIRGYKYYFCVMARSVSENLHFGIGENDFLDMRDAVDNRKIFVEYNMGYSDKGYLDMCNHCYGADASKHLIPVAEQCLRNVQE